MDLSRKGRSQCRKNDTNMYTGRCPNPKFLEWNVSKVNERDVEEIRVSHMAKLWPPKTKLSYKHNF